MMPLLLCMILMMKLLMLDTTVPLGEFLDEQLARGKVIENAETNEVL